MSLFLSCNDIVADIAERISFAEQGKLVAESSEFHSLADPVGGGLRGLQPPLIFPKNSGNPRGRCDRFSCYFIKQCVFVCVE